jgi:hypothetical protein
MSKAHCTRPQRARKVHFQLIPYFAGAPGTREGRCTRGVMPKALTLLKAEATFFIDDLQVGDPRNNRRDLKDGHLNSSSTWRIFASSTREYKRAVAEVAGRLSPSIFLRPSSRTSNGI